MDTSASSIVTALDEASRKRLVQRGVPRTLDRGEPLYIAGEPGGRIHLVVDGLLKLSATDPGGRETILGLVVPGEITGELAAIDGGDHPLDAVAISRTAVIGFDAPAFLDAVTRERRAATELLITLAARNRWMCTTAFERTTSEVPARLAGRLLDLADAIGCTRGGSIEMNLPIGQSDLGSLAGMCRESASRTLQRFRRAGVVDYRGRKLRILRPDVLEKVRCAGRAARPSRSEGAEGCRRSRSTAVS